MTQEKIRKALLEMVHYTPDVECEKIYKINKEECIAWLEKQGEQNNSNVKDYNSIDPHFGKPTDKIEPNFNFNVGQWIIATGKCVYLITKIDGFNVTLVDVDSNEYVFDTSSLEDAHLWTIQDAKDGDVLCSHHSEVDYPWIGIFHKLNTDNTFDSHCYLPAGEHGKFCPPSKKDIFGRKYVKNHLSTHMVPAAKEQRDLLFQKMKEAGYEWDTEKKILNEIKNEIEIPFSAKDSELQEATYYIPKGFHAEIDSNKVVIKKDEILDKWSKDDERICQCLIRDQEKALDDVRNDKYGHSEIISDLKEMYRERIDWLKSLKDKCISQKDI